MAYYLIPHRYRWALLLAGSYYFYMCWKLEYIVLILISTTIDYIAGLQMGKEPEKKKRKKWLIASLTVNLGMLFFFKYFNFFSENVELLFSKVNVLVDIPSFNYLLPVGISFYTFQTLSYSIDVYRGKIKPEKHFGYFALFVSYFPQLVAGPIEKADRLIPQLKHKPKVVYEDFRYGINKILLGFFKKVVVADSIAPFVDTVYANPGGYTGIQLFFTAFIFGSQLFCDFSGYTDIAIGSARLMGVRLKENFNIPYWISNFQEFWSKWHMSLTDWIGEYVYRPLLRLKNKVKWQTGYIFVTIGIVFITIGIWHGAEWTFFWFGVANAVTVIVQRFTKRSAINLWLKEFRIYRILNNVFNLTLQTMYCIMFRSADMTDALTQYKIILTDFSLNFGELLAQHKYDFLLSVGLTLLAICTVAFNRQLRFKYNFLYVLGMLFLILFFGQDLDSQFIYFQF